MGIYYYLRNVSHSYKSFKACSLTEKERRNKMIFTIFPPAFHMDILYSKSEVAKDTNSYTAYTIYCIVLYYVLILYTAKVNRKYTSSQNHII